MTHTEDKPVNANHQAENAAAVEKQHPLTDKDNNTGGKPDGTANPLTEHGGPKGLEPTRYGDWERNSRCTDF